MSFYKSDETWDKYVVAITKRDKVIGEEPSRGHRQYVQRDNVGGLGDHVTWYLLWLLN